ncbi:uncharacterized protein LOC123718460 [Pieris brassicae]|uniref:uncharacterized protein LOC123718460 n=1 Tax=Pieris brassicae TaxID=7116 RepID=UPI001E661A01|nr:uncharacterized protein LOC123718460 [Pieris brassicae]
MLVLMWTISLFSISRTLKMEHKFRHNLDSPRWDMRSNHINRHSHDFYQIDGVIPNNEELQSYFNFLSNLSGKLIENIRENIKTNYGLEKYEASLVDSNFNSTNSEYQIILQDYFKKMLKNSKYNDSTIFLLDFIDLSNFLLQSVVENNLSDLKAKTSLSDIWYNQPFKFTVLRQQMKILMNVMEIEICNNLSICIGNTIYSEFIVEYLRNLLDTKENSLKSFFLAVSDILYEHMHSIKGNEVFRKKMEILPQLDSIYQRDAVDFMDEILTGQDTDIFKAQFIDLVQALRDLIKFIDENYDLNYENVDKLDDLSKSFYKLKKYSNSDIKTTLEELVNNMEVNVKIWPLQVQSKLDHLWTQVTQIAARI